MSEPGSTRDHRQWRIVSTLAAQALDDVEEGRLEVAEALRLVAHYAWLAGRAEATELP